MMRTIVLWALYWGPSIWGNNQVYPGKVRVGPNSDDLEVSPPPSHRQASLFNNSWTTLTVVPT